ncbi:PspC domain-containing protein [Marivirga sp. S37H4]|uniref:PspC domain-containing protein n=1 Tax=Marivirga aurantiaca TaxID=2802615 RepID=A0A934WXB9_9BACT|nr:PspC domain-containing protein [Marivirga aurantiaca]MBK6264848.1 PspC domain-containing protein [Marivirga aurantiaca]
MKKNISINIGGIIFHVEEDGFEALKKYLDTINHYFSDFEDSQEIINDIENRIAEIFLSKLKDDKQVISYEDIQSLMATLGSIEDFKKAEEQTEEKEASYENKSAYEESGEPRKLYRDVQRKILGGVAAGIAHYFNVDALWIRLAMLLLFIGTSFANGFSLFVALVYIVCWIFLPSNPFLKEDEKVKKFYRSEDNKVIAGVAKGLSAYFGVDVAVIRIIFVLLLIPGGAGFFIYLVLWLITPYARTVTQKMQMEGTPITLSNIEQNIKSGLNVKEGEETPIVKVLLFPFRLIAIILNGMAKALGPVLNFVVEAIRVVMGIVLLVFGLVASVSVVIATLISQGIVANSDYFHFGDIPYQLISNTIPSELIIAIVILLLIPAIFISIAGISVLAKRWVLNKTVGFSLLGVWVLGIIMSAILIPATALKFSKEATVTEVETFKIEDKIAVLKVNEAGYEDRPYTRITLKGYEGNEFKLEKNFEAKGSTRMEAEENAKMVTHHVELREDSVLWIDLNFRFNEDAIFRAQSLRMTLYIPYNQPFQMDRKMRYLLRNTIYINGYNVKQIPYNTWMFNEEGLQCLSCEQTSARVISGESDSFYEAPFYINDNIAPVIYNFDDFDRISGATGLFLEIHQGDEYQVAVFSDEDDLDDLQITNRNGKLRLSYSSSGWKWRNTVPDIKCVITLPELEKLELSSGAVAHVVDFNAQDFHAELSSAAKVYAKGIFKNVEIDLSSASKAILGGKTDYLNADLSSAAKVEAFDLIANKGRVDVSSAAKAEVTVKENLNAQASSAGIINYEGNPQVSSNSSSGGQIKREN